jgi:GH43 family beta-xylosidase
MPKAGKISVATASTLAFLLMGSTHSTQAQQPAPAQQPTPATPAPAAAPAQKPAQAPAPKPPIAPPAPNLPEGMFSNPIVRTRSAADPWLVYRDGFYYFTFTTGGSVEIWKSATITGLAQAEKKVVWRAPKTGPNSQHVWAPEIHYVNDKWYIYYTATDGPDANRRQFVLEAKTPDPMGEYTEKGRLFVADEDVYAIDGTILQTTDNQLYYVWSGRATNGGGAQNIYIAAMENPWTLKGKRTLLSTPTYEWERAGWWVNEGPEIIQRNGKTFIVYSGSGGTTSRYCLGLLSHTKGGDLLKAENWTKSNVPIFSQYKGPDGVVYTPGHNGFCKSPDGTEDWIVYHGKDYVDGTWSGRTARAQKFTWNPDDSPNFGHPIPANVPLALPSGEVGSKPLPSANGTGLQGEYFPTRDLTGTKITRADTSLNFDWRTEAPMPGIPADGFSARWTGQIQPRYSETYTFQTYADDGVRVWVDGKKIIDGWKDRPATADQGTIKLEAGKKYDIRVEYFDNVNEARLALYWLSPSQPFEPIPQSQLFPPKKR